MSSICEVTYVFENLGLDAGMVDQFVSLSSNSAWVAVGEASGMLVAGAVK